jgi:polyribonucleotide nucleotidyltransferase
MAKVPKAKAEVAEFRGEGLLVLLEDKVYFINKEALAQYLMQPRKGAVEIVKNYLNTIKDPKKGIAAITPMFHIMEGGG